MASAEQADPSIQVEVSLSMLIESEPSAPGPDNLAVTRRVPELSACLLDQMLSQCDIVIEEDCPETRKEG